LAHTGQVVTSYTLKHSVPMKPKQIEASQK